MVIAVIGIKTKFGMQGKQSKPSGKMETEDSMHDSDEQVQSAESIKEGENYTEDSVVSIKDKLVAPQTIKGLLGKKVIWKNMTSKTHTIVFDKGGYFTPAIKPEKTAEIIFDTVGKFPYHSKEAPSIKGVVTIVE